MMRNSILAGILGLLTLVSPGVEAQEAQTGSGETDGYKLVWQDLFDGDELNTKRWHVELNGGGGGNNELQFYVNDSDNAIVGKDEWGNGCLILTAKREEFWNKPFTSGRVNSKNMIAFKHGKVEAAIKLPKTANGLWPAFWLMGNDYDAVKWPRCGEIDIMEFGHADGIRKNQQETFFNGACHWGKNTPQMSSATHHNHAYSLQDGEFHLYTMIWDEKSIAMYCDLDKYPDQEPYFKKNIEGESETFPNWAGNFFHKEFFILFNLAVGGNFPNIYDANEITALNDENGQRASMYINYVKIYQKGTPDESQFFTDPGDELSEAGIETVLADDGASRGLIRLENGSVSCEGARRIGVYDLCGRLLEQGGCSVNASRLGSGMFVVRAELADGTSVCDKLALK